MHFNIQPIEYGPALAMNVEKALHHAQLERFTESAGPGEQRDFVIRPADEIILQIRLMFMRNSVPYSFLIIADFW